MDAGDWIAIGSGTVAIVAAGISVWQARTARKQAQAADEQVAIARQQLEQGERALREQNEPYVIVDIQPHDPTSGVLVVVIENIGPTVARNVQITTDPPLESGWGDDLTEMLRRALARTIPMLPPGRRLKYLFDNLDRFGSDLPTAYNFTVKSEGPYGPLEPLEYTVDFGTWAESLRGQRPTKHLEDKLGKVHTELRNLTSHFKLANAPRIREEQERTQRALRERQERRSGSTPPAPDT